MSGQFIDFDKDQLDRVQGMLSHIPGATAKAMYRALNRATQNARSNIVKQARNSYSVQAKEVRSTLKIKRANKNNLMAQVNSTGSVIPLIAFKVNPKTVSGRRTAPIRVGVRKGTASPLANAFIARINGKVGVAERVGTARFPIRRLFGPSAPQMVGNEEVLGKVSDEAVEMLNRRLDHEIQNILAGRGR
jgi:hypothetical protein